MPEVKPRRLLWLPKPGPQPAEETDEAPFGDDVEADYGYGGEELEEAMNEIERQGDANLRGEPIEERVRSRFAVRRRARSSDEAPAGSVRDVYPSTAPGMPRPGADLLRIAEAMQGDAHIVGKGKNAKLESTDGVLETIYEELLYSAGNIRIPLTVRGNQQKDLVVVGGHLWNDDATPGPTRADVMVIGKMLGEDEKNFGRNLIGPTGELLKECCEELQIPDTHRWYVTNLLKTEHPQADTGNTTLKATWINEFMPLLHQELRLVRPQYILCLGADATKALLGKKATIKGMTGRVIEYTYPISRGDDRRDMSHTALVMCCTHPAAVLHDPDQRDSFESGMARFGQLVSGLRPDREEEDLDHREIDTLQQLIDLYHETQRDCTENLLAIDAEWHGDHPQNSNAYLRTIQISWKHKAAVCIHIRHAGGRWRFRGKQKEIVYWLKKICRGRRIAGHFFSADLEWLIPFGLDLRPHFDVADTWEQTRRNALSYRSGGFDTALAMHAFEETAEFGLKPASLRFTSAPPYDTALIKWRDSYCSERKLKKEEMEGYGECPDSVLVPYANYDADITRRLAILFPQRLSVDRFGNDCWEAFWINMRAQPAALEITMTGICVDRERADRMTETYMAAKQSLETKIRDWARWPDMNLQSVFHVREFLFGEMLNGKDRNPEDPPIRLRPTGARSLKLEPTMSTDKRPMAWSEVIRRGLMDQKMASTNKTSLAILAQENQEVLRWHPKLQREIKYDFSEQVTWLRDFRFVSQVLKSVLRVPVINEETQDFVKMGDYYVYPGGMMAVIAADGRIHTSVYQTKETARWSTARPATQNFAKRREPDYKRILGDMYRWPLRTILRAPEGSLLLEADFIGAELYGMALMSGDEQMIEHARRNLLPEYDPDFYDIHSNIAVLAFQLNCPPTKGGLKSIGKSELRIVAKAVVFGVAYGRGAKAIALAVKEEKVYISVEEAQAVIDAIFELYPGLVPFFANCRERSQRERWLCGPFGRYRRFPQTKDRLVAGDFEREAMNFPIQGLVADAMNIAIAQLYRFRSERPDICYKIALQIHDAVLLEVPYSHVVPVIDEVLPECMTNRVPIWPTALDGTPDGRGPYHLGIDITPFVSWGQQMMPSDCLARELPPRIARWREEEDGYTHPDLLNKIWRGDATGGKIYDLAT